LFQLVVEVDFLLHYSALIAFVSWLVFCAEQWKIKTLYNMQTWMFVILQYLTKFEYVVY